MLIPIDEVVHFTVTTSSASTGAVTDADSAPTFNVFEENSDADIFDVGSPSPAPSSMTKRAGLTGNYRGSFTASAANGFEAGKWYSVVVSATVGGVAGKCVAMHFRVGPAESEAGVPVGDLSSAARNAAADSLLNRDMSVGTDSGSATVRTVRQALRFLRNAWTVSGSTLTVKREDDTTTDWTGTVSQDGSANPITGVDPASS